MKRKILSNENDLILFAKEFSKKLKRGDIVFLHGNLGAGKTTFTKGIAQGLSINETITSPTFSIIKEYDNRLCHVDAYRLKNEEVGLDYYLDNYIIVIEWPENLIDDITPNYEIMIDYHLQGRKIEVKEN